MTTQKKANQKHTDRPPNTDHEKHSAASSQDQQQARNHLAATPPVTNAPPSWWSSVSTSDRIQFGILGLAVVGILFTWLSLRQGTTNARSGQRAYVLVDDLTLQSPLSTEPLKIVGVVKNTGQTPALRLRIYRGLILDTQVPEFAAGGEPDVIDESVSDLGAGQTAVIDFDRALIHVVNRPQRAQAEMIAKFPALTPTHLEWLRSGWKLYARVVIRYRDVFATQGAPDNETESCFYVRGNELLACERGSRLR